MDKLTAEHARELLEYDPSTGSLTWKHRPVEMFSSTATRSAEHSARNWNSKCAGRPALNKVGNTGHKVGGIWGKSYLAHRVAWLIHYGEWPNVIDHINGDQTDNRIENLRNVTQRVNAKNSRLRKDNTSGQAGVTWLSRERRWQASINKNKGREILGYFKCKDEAIAVRRAVQVERGFTERHGAQSCQ